MTAVAVRGLIVRFGETLAVDRVDLDVRSGELFLLLGPSGCGKTTLLRCVAGFTEPAEGSIRFDGEDVTRLAPHLRKTGMVFQSLALFPHLSVGDNVAFGVREQRVARPDVEERVQAALELVRMERYARRPVHELSGGEQQRVAIARALAVRPRCLLLDEPLSSLDARLRQSMRQEIRRVCKEAGLTALYVTHDQKEALAIADRIAVMERGRVLQAGPPAEVYRRPASRAVATFLGETNLLEGTVRAISPDGEIRITTALGVLLAKRTEGSAARSEGDRVWVSIRPECIAMGPSEPAFPAGANVLSGRVEGTTYLGEIAEHWLQSGETRLRVYELNPAPGSAAGGPRAAMVAPSDVVLLPFDGHHV